MHTGNVNKVSRLCMRACVCIATIMRGKETMTLVCLERSKAGTCKGLEEEMGRVKMM